MKYLLLSFLCFCLSGCGPNLKVEDGEDTPYKFITFLREPARIFVMDNDGATFKFSKEVYRLKKINTRDKDWIIIEMERIK